MKTDTKNDLLGQALQDIAKHIAKAGDLDGVVIVALGLNGGYMNICTAVASKLDPILLAGSLVDVARDFTLDAKAKQEGKTESAHDKPGPTIN